MGEVTSNIQLSYLSSGTWKSFNNEARSTMDALKIQTGTGKSYYLTYKTWNNGQSGYYPDVNSTVNDFAGSSMGKAIQQLNIKAFNNDGTKLTSGVVVMYRALVDDVWLPWVSNADPEWMSSVHTKYNMGGTIDVASSFAGKTGKNISGIDIRVFEEGGTSAPDGKTGTEVSATLSYMVDNASIWNGFLRNVTAPKMDGIKIRTNVSRSYYLTYKTLNQGQAGYYPEVNSTIESDYAGSAGKAIQQLNIKAFSKDGTKLTAGIVVMYRALVDGVWLPWVSNADPEWMVSVQAKYNLGGTLDTVSGYAGKTGKNISGIDIRIFEESTNSSSETPAGLLGNEIAPSLAYLANGTSTWVGFTKNITGPQIDGLKIRTSINKSYYLNYKTWNQGQSGYYPEIRSTTSDYAGSAEKPIQQLNIRVYNNSGAKLTSGVVVMYRAYVEGRWLPWVSNADPEWMISVQAKYGLDGTLDTAGGYAGISGKNITGIEVRIFEETNATPTPQTPTGTNKIIQAPQIYQMINYPTGCESVSAVMALNHVGINTSVDTFIDQYLDKSGLLFDPYITFGGNPRSTSGYGCYAPVIKKALDKILRGTGYHAKILNNVSMQQLCSDYIDKNIPVITWATMNMATPSNGASWLYEGKRIQWIKPEHCLLLVGYDANNYIFNDPQRTQPQTYYNKTAVETAYKGLFSQAIVIVKDLPFVNKGKLITKDYFELSSAVYDTKYLKENTPVDLTFSGNWSVVKYVNDYNTGLQAMLVAPKEEHEYQQYKNLVLVLAGTDIKSREDIKEDALSIFLQNEEHANSVSSQFYWANAFTENILNTYPDAFITCTGHSLGGSLAKYVSIKNSGISHTITFAAPNTFGLYSSEEQSRIKSGKYKSIIIDFDQPNDPIGLYLETEGRIEGTQYFVNANDGIHVLTSYEASFTSNGSILYGT